MTAGPQGRALPALRSGLVNSAALASGTLTALILPPVLVRSLDAAGYSVWMLCLQTVTLVSLFELGVGLTATRLIGERLEGSWLPRSAWSVARAALRIHLVVVAVVAVLLAVSTAALPAVFPGIPTEAVPEARITWLALGIVAAAQIPVQSMLAPLAALQRAYPVVVAAAVASLVASLLVIVVAWRTGSLMLMASAWALANLVGVGYAVTVTRRKRPRSDAAGRGSASAVGLVYRETRWQSLILLLAFLVSGLDVAIVGRFAFEEVAAFAVAASIVIRLAAVMHALQAPLLTEYARDMGAGAVQRLADLVARQVRLGTLAVVLCLGAVAAMAPALVPIWLGRDLGEPAATYLVWLALGAGIRLLGIPVASLATATGHQRITVVVGMLECGVNLVLSLLLVQVLGPVGVALGTIAGGLVSLASHLTLTVPRVDLVEDLRGSVLRAGARSTIPLLLLVGGTLLALQSEATPTQLLFGAGATVAAAGAGLALTCSAGDRELGARIARRVAPRRLVRR